MTDQSLDRPTTTPSNGAADHLVVLVHGINTRALWMDEVKPALESAGFTVAPTSYGQFSILRFLAPFLWLRNKPVERVAKAVRTAIRSYKNSNGGNAPKKMSVISHSFGTYIVGRLLTDFQDLEWYRVIFCGSVVREDYPLDKVLNQFTSPLLNEIGTRDFLPALAESAGWGYGSVGSTGFNAPPVETRWHHGYRHCDFLTQDFCKTYWIPFLQGQRPAPADPPMKMPLWIRLLAMLPLRWIILAIEALVLAAIIYFVVAFVRTEAGFDGGACRLTPPSTPTPLREETANGVLNYLAVLQSQQRDEKFKQLYQDRFIRPDGWTGTVEDLPDAKNGGLQVYGQRGREFSPNIFEHVRHRMQL
ncbi:esterase/lipase family protein [Bradyrhizobium sp. USDA 4471]